jgi:hypothetical protein
LQRKCNLKNILPWLFPLGVAAISPLETESMLFQADKLAKMYAPLVAKAPPPPLTPQTDALLSLASNWLSIDLTTVKTDGRSVLSYLSQSILWDALAEIGIEAVELKGLKSPIDAPTSFQIDEQFGTEQEYALLANTALKKGVRLVGKALGVVTGQGADFALALKNMGAYPELYALIEIDPQDWNLLPEVKKNSLSSNIPWLTIQNLHKKGYVPTDYAPYLKQSGWNATAPIVGSDQKQRRWIYLRDTEGSPHLDWLNPSFGALRLVAADSLYSMLRLGQPILELEGLPPHTEETMSLTIRKLGGFSVAIPQGGVESLHSCTDASYDLLTPMASLHALIAQDASALKLMYDLMLENGVPAKRLVHALEPFGRNPNDWTELIHSPHTKHKYHEEEVTAEELRNQLLRDDLLRTKSQKSSNLSWKSVPHVYPEIVPCRPENKSEKKREGVKEGMLALHVNLAKFFAWQPGIFSLSPQDLLGAAPEQQMLDLLGPNNDCLYSCAPSQLANPYSFASQLKKILRIRKDLNLAKATFLQTIATEHKEVLILRYQLLNQTEAILAVNFSQKPLEEMLESFVYAHTSVIDPLTGLTENKGFDSSFFTLKIDPFSTKLLIFQPKHYHQ